MLCVTVASYRLKILWQFETEAVSVRSQFRYVMSGSHTVTGSRVLGFKAWTSSQPPSTFSRGLRVLVSSFSLHLRVPLSSFSLRLRVWLLPFPFVSGYWPLPFPLSQGAGLFVFVSGYWPLPFPFVSGCCLQCLCPLD